MITNLIAAAIRRSKESHTISVKDLEDHVVTSILASDSGTGKSLEFKHYCSTNTTYYRVRQSGTVTDFKTLDGGIEYYNQL